MKLRLSPSLPLSLLLRMLLFTIKLSILSSVSMRITRAVFVSKGALVLNMLKLLPTGHEKQTVE